MDPFLKGVLQGSIPVVVLVGGTHHIVKKLRETKPVLYWGSIIASAGLAFAIVQGKIPAPFMNAEEDDLYYCSKCDEGFSSINPTDEGQFCDSCLPSSATLHDEMERITMNAEVIACDVCETNEKLFELTDMAYWSVLCGQCIKDGEESHWLIKTHIPETFPAGSKGRTTPKTEVGYRFSDAETFESPAEYCPDCGGRMDLECQDCGYMMAENFGADENRFMIACGRCGWNFTDEYIKDNTDGNIRPMYGDHCSCGGMIKRYDFEPEPKPKGFFAKLFGKNAETFEASGTKKPKLTPKQKQALDMMKYSYGANNNKYAYVEVDNRGWKPHRTRQVQALLNKGLIEIEKGENRNTHFHGYIENYKAYIVKLTPLAWEYKYEDPFGKYTPGSMYQQDGDKMV